MIILFLIMAIPIAKANEIAYDCASADDAISTFSLVDLAKCPTFKRSYSNATSETIQVLQKTSNTNSEAHSCKIILNRLVCRCEYFTSSQFGCQPSTIDYQLPVTTDQCKEIIKTGTFNDEEFNVTGIKVNIPKSKTFYSHGDRQLTGYCVGSTFTRNDIIYTKSFERTDVTISVNQLNLQVEPSLIEADSEDVLLPFGIRWPARHQYFIDPRIGTIIWTYNRPSCPQFGQSAEGFQTIYQGPADVSIRTGAKFQERFQGALFSVKIDKPKDATIPQNFALATHTNSSICGRLAWNTNVENVMIVILGYGETGIITNKKYGLSRPHLLDFKSQVTAQYLDSHHRIEDVAERLYMTQCKTEEKAIRNFQAILTTTNFPSLRPYFPEGFTAIPAAAAIHVIKCPSIPVAIDATREGCFEELPVVKLTPEGTPLNGSFWSHPVTKILMDRGTPITCSEALPLMYKLVGGTYVCQLGRGLHQCKAPEVFKPDSASLSDQITHSFHKILGIGILTATTIRDLAIRIHEPFYRQVLEAELTARNIQYGYIAKGLPLEPFGSNNFKQKLANMVGAKISPMFATLGRMYIYIVSTFVILAIISSILGVLTRAYWEIKHHGFTHRLLFVFFDGIWAASRMPLDLLKGGIRGATESALKSNVAGVTEPLQQQINNLTCTLNHLSQEDYIRQQNNTHFSNNGSPTPPPSYPWSEKPIALKTEEQTINRNRRHSFHDNSSRRATNDNLQKSDDPTSSGNQTPPDHQHLHQRRRRSMASTSSSTIRQPTNADTLYPQEVEMTEMTEQLLPIGTPSASSILREDLARFQEEDLARYHGTIQRRRPASEIYQRPPTPTGPNWYTSWQPPMPFPPAKPQPYEPAPELPKVNRGRMNMRPNLTLPEDQPPRKLSRSNSQIAQCIGPMTSEVLENPQGNFSTNDLQIRQQTRVETPRHQQGTLNQQVETMEQNPELHEDENIPQLFKAIANKQV